MAIKDYTYGELITEIKEEFGFDASKDLFVERRLNRAMQMLTRRRETWHFLLRPLTLNIVASNTGVADFANGSADLANVTALPLGAVRNIIAEGTQTGDLTSGYIIHAENGTNRTMDAQFTGTAGLGKAVTSTVAYHALPADFTKMYMLMDANDPLERIKWMDPYKFEILKLRGLSMGSIRRHYTVMSDPLPSAHTNSVKAPFLVVYPYPAAQTTLRGLYFFTFQNMDSTTDISFIPQSNRSLLVTAASWFIATALGDSRVDEYKMQTTAEIEEMASEASFSDDDQNLQTGLGRFLEADGIDTPDGPGLMQSFNSGDDW